MNSHHSNPTPPTRACLELPDQAALTAAGIMLDLDTARVALAALSWLIAKGRSKSRGIVYNTLRGLVDVARIDVVRYGELLLAPVPTCPRMAGQWGQASSGDWASPAPTSRSTGRRRRTRPMMPACRSNGCSVSRLHESGQQSQHLSPGGQTRRACGWRPRS